MIRVSGVLDFGMVGVLAEISHLLAGAGIPIFVISTFDTDYILIKSAHYENARNELTRNVHLFM